MLKNNLLSCSACFEANVSHCSDIIIKAGFDPGTNLYWLVRKPHLSKVYQKLATTDESGNLTILKSDLPNGYLTTESIIKIELRSGVNYLQPVLFFFGGTQYACILATLLDIKTQTGDNSPVNVIQFTESLIFDPSENDVSKLFIQYAGSVSASYTNSQFQGKTILLLATELQILKDSDFTLSGTTVSFTNGDTFKPGNWYTFILKS